MRLDRVAASSRFLIAICLFGVAGFVYAEGRCPDGYFPIGGGSAGWEGCAPMGHDPGQNSDQGSNNSRPAEWEPRWGAIGLVAVDGGRSLTCVPKSKPRKLLPNNAEKPRTVMTPNAMMLSVTTNQCAVIAWGATGYILQGAIDVPTASSIGMQKCTSKHAECEIFYSGCSYPKRIQ